MTVTTENAKRYRIVHTADPLSLDDPLNSGPWQAPFLSIAEFRPEGSNHRPCTRVKLLYNERGIFGRFHVRDRYVRCVRHGFQAPVYKDSCVEFFVQPTPGGGYFNFEFNCGGSLLAFYITDPERTPEGFKSFTRLLSEDAAQIDIRHSLPARIELEIKTETIWDLGFFIPFATLEKYAGPLKIEKGTTWRGNFYKCGDETSHPHWGAWAPVDALNFHLPRCFGTLLFA